MLDRAPDQKIRALISLLYITGWRVSEILQIRKEDIEVKEGYVFLTGVALKRRERKPFRHTIKFSIETPFWQHVRVYLDTLDIEQKLFPLMSRFSVVYHLKRLNPTTYCHLFRHTRATRLAEKGATDQQLQTWFGWKRNAMAGEYVRRSPKLIENLADKVD